MNNHQQTTIQFLGGAGTVTGSKYLVHHKGFRLLIDCGMFQGYKQLRLKNWKPLPFSISDLNAVVLTHAHIDHSGSLPLLVKQGYNNPIYATPATRALCRILLPDAGRLQEEEARFVSKYELSKHKPAQPLFTEEHAQQSLRLFQSVRYGKSFSLTDEIQFRLLRVGHIQGSAMVELRLGSKTVLFSGDVGRPNDLVMRPPEPPPACDILLVESTYGDRRHADVDPLQSLAEVVNRTATRGGVLVIPAFAVGRTQVLLYFLYLLRQQGQIPDIPIYIDSPMATAVTEMFDDFPEDLRISQEEFRAAQECVDYAQSVQQSKQLSHLSSPAIIISASGMATGGRVLHHLKAYLPGAKNTILFGGYQAGGTRGRSLLDGASEIKIHGQKVAARAEIALIDNLSAHADYVELTDWLRGMPSAPQHTYIVHGEPGPADHLRYHLQDELGWDCYVPESQETIVLGE